MKQILVAQKLVNFRETTPKCPLKFFLLASKLNRLLGNAFEHLFTNNTTRIGFYQVFFIQKTLQIRVISEKTLQTSPRDFLEKNPPKSEKAQGLFWKKP